MVLQQQRIGRMDRGTDRVVVLVHSGDGVDESRLWRRVHCSVML